MKEQGWFDLGRIFDEVFETAQNWGHAFKDEFKRGGRCHPFGFSWDENVDFYPLYNYPPANIYITGERELVFEFAFAGFSEKDISLEFQGDYMVISATPSVESGGEGVKYFKRRLKFKEIKDHKYYVPEKKFNREDVQAVYKDGILKIVVPPKEDYASGEGIKVEIVREDD
jgi:HSP20 family molecular chaperone IbpA